jgi:hypothetical protein
MNETPKGKIGRLPKALQEQVNRRLENGEKARPLAAWLNSLPEVRALLAAEFAGLPIREQNLSEWRSHGYKQWLWRRQAFEMAQEMASTTTLNSPPATGTSAPPFTDQMAAWVTVRYLIAIRKLADTNTGGKPDLKTLREFLHDVVAVRRGDHSAARLKMAQNRLERRSVLREGTQPNASAVSDAK